MVSVLDAYNMLDTSAMACYSQFVASGPRKIEGPHYQEH
jgi:hypothetical protein